MVVVVAVLCLENRSKYKFAEWLIVATFFILAVLTVLTYTKVMPKRLKTNQLGAL